MKELDDIITRSLTHFTNDVFSSGWWGKEREAISLYVMGYLIEECRPNTILFDKCQIGIEVRVPKPSSLGKKKEVCKDLVIWPKPKMTCWNPEKKSILYPISVLEWKANISNIYKDDLIWLHAFAQDLPDFIGYAITLDLRIINFRLRCARVTSDNIEENWLSL